MINFDIDELSVEKIDDKINILNRRLLPEEDFATEYSLDFLSSINAEQRNKIFETLDMAQQISEFDSFFNALIFLQDEDAKILFAETIHSLQSNMEKIILELNSRRSNKLNEIRSENDKIRKEIEFYEKLKDYLTLPFSYRDEDYTKLITFIDESDISPEQKVELSLKISSILIEKSKTIVLENPTVEEEIPSENFEEFENDLIDVSEGIDSINLEDNEGISEYRRRQIELANAKYEQYESIIGTNALGSIEAVYANFKLSDINDKEPPMDNFLLYLFISVAAIRDKKLSDEEIAQYVNIIENIDQIYQREKENDRILQEKKNKLNEKLKIVNGIKEKYDDLYQRLKTAFSTRTFLSEESDKEFFKQLTDLQDRVKNIEASVIKLNLESTEKEIETVSGILDNIEMILNTFEVNANVANEHPSYVEGNNTPIELRKFVLFDTNDQTKKSFLFEDMLGSDPFIDQAAISGNDVSSEDINYQQNIAKLIKELMTLGKSKYMHSINTSAQNYGEKILSIIYKTDKNGNIIRKPEDKTSLWRIRPTPTSNIRFIEREVVIPQDSELFAQVKELIQKHLPKVVIPKDKFFTIIVNFGCGIKKSDNDIYDIAYGRFKSRDVKRLALFYENGNYGKQQHKATKLKSKLSDIEYKLLEEYIVSSLQSLYEMSKADSKFDFKFIDSMGGDKNYGLQ